MISKLCLVPARHLVRAVGGNGVQFRGTSHKLFLVRLQALLGEMLGESVAPSGPDCPIRVILATDGYQTYLLNVGPIS